MAEAPVTTVRLLGGISVRRDRESADGASSRALTLLAYLVVRAPAGQPRPHLAALFWPDSPDAQARTNLRRELHQLRRLVPDECLRVDATSIGWSDHPSCDVDVARFLHAASAAERVGRGRERAGSGFVGHGRRALEAYAGPLLPGRYDDWVLSAREELHHRCVRLCDRLVDELEASGGLEEGIEVARRRIALEPLEETGYRTLMRLQIAGHDRSGALTTYHRCVSVLEEHLGVAPTAETAQVLSAIIDAAEAGSAVDALVRASVRVERARKDALVGRDQQIDAVLSRWREAVAGTPGMLLLTGDPGVGKSRLLDELVRSVEHDGGAVARSRSFSSSGLALAPVADWLRAPDVAAAVSSIDQVWQDEVARLVPSGAGTDPAVALRPHDNARAFVDSWQRHRFYEGLSQAVLAVDRPLLLVLDDAHWCEPETLAWLAFLLGTARGRPLLVLATARRDELERRPGLREVLGNLAGAGLLGEVPVEPLSLQATAELAARQFGQPVPEPEAATLHAVSGGYPLYVVEAARASAQPDGMELSEQTLTAVLNRRLQALSAEARRCAALSAAFGRDFSLDLLLAASDQDEVGVVRAVDELWRRRIVRQTERGYDFTHDLLRDEAYASVDPAQRWLAHRRIARALEATYAGDLDAVAVDIAEQHRRGGRPEDALPYYLRAGIGAVQLFANEQAVQHFRRALDILADLAPSGERHRRELEVRQAMSAPLNALRGYADRDLKETFERSVALAELLGRKDQELSGLVGLWASTFVQGDIDASHDIAARAIGLADEVPGLANQAHFALGGSAMSLGRPALAVQELDLACDLSQGQVSLNVGSRPEVHARAWSAHAWWLLGDVARARAAAREAVEDARTLGHPYSTVIAHAYAAVTAQLCGDLDALDESLDELTTLSRQHAYAYYREWALVLGGWRTGGARGVAQCKLGVAHLSTSGALTRMPYWLALLAETKRGIGDDASADASLDAAWTTSLQRGDRWWLPEVLRLRARSKPEAVALDLLHQAESTALELDSPILAARCRADLAARDAGAVHTDDSPTR